jgi:hypothetical protein
MKYIIIILTFIILISCEQNISTTTAIKQDHNDSEKQDKNITTGQENISSKVERWFEPLSLDTTIKCSNEMQITLQHTDSIFISEYYIDSKTLDSINSLHGNWHLRALDIEKYQLKKFHQYIKRDSNGLSIKLKDNNWLLLTLNPKYDEVDNTFEYYFKDYGFYSIRTQWGEGNDYKLINDLNGEITYLFGRPYFSPNGQYVVSVNADIEAGYSSNGFQIFKNNNGKLSLICTYEPSSWGPFSAKWIDNETFVTKNITIELKNEQMDYMYFYSKIKIK